MPAVCSAGPLDAALGTVYRGSCRARGCRERPRWQQTLQWLLMAGAAVSGRGSLNGRRPWSSAPEALAWCIASKRTQPPGRTSATRNKSTVLIVCRCDPPQARQGQLVQMVGRRPPLPREGGRRAPLWSPPPSGCWHILPTVEPGCETSVGRKNHSLWGRSPGPTGCPETPPKQWFLALIGGKKMKQEEISS